MPCSAARTRDRITPYASLQPAGHSFEEYRDALVKSALKAKALGFTAMKSEVTMNGPYAHSGMRESLDSHTEVVAAVRKAVGPDVTLMVDVQYLWDDADDLPVHSSRTGPSSTCTSWRRRSSSDNVEEHGEARAEGADEDRQRRVAGDPATNSGN